MVNHKHFLELNDCMAFVIQMANFPGPFCEAAGINSEITVLKAHSSLPRVGKEKLVKGIIVELNDFRKEKKLSWDTFYQWIMEICSMLPSLSALKVSLGRFDDKKRLLRKNKQHSMLMNEPFLVCKQKAPVVTPRLEVVVLAQVNQS